MGDTHGIDDAISDAQEWRQRVPRFQVAKYVKKCPLCGEEIESYDSYSEANEMLDGHMQTEHDL